MSGWDEWRGFDLRARKAKIERAFNLAEVTSPEDVPIVINTPCYFAFAGEHIPEDYFSNPASMLEYQARGYEAHLARVNDDYVPYFMPWFGTGVLASAFGCEIRLAPGPGNDPAVAGPCVTSPRDVARLRLPDPYRDGWMPRVLDAIDYARACGDLPVGLTDMQGPLDTVGQMCGQARLYEWMYREPKMVHELFELVTTAFIQWVKVQKQHIGEPLNSSNGLQGVWAPPGVGVWESDDDLVLIDAHLYEEFVLPHVSRILEEFGGGQVHFCGNGVHQLENLLKLRGLRAVCNSPLGKFEAFATLYRRLHGRATIWIQDAAPVEVEEYYTRLFASVEDFRGILLAPFVLDAMGMDREGGYVPVRWDPFEVANRIVAIVRECVRRRLAGEPFKEETAAALHPPTQGQPPSREGKTVFSFMHGMGREQRLAIEKVQDCLISFDGEGLKAAIRAALEAGLAPFDIVTFGLAEGMAEVGRLYEAGEYFLPELVMAGSTMNQGMSILQPLLKGKSSGHYKGTIVIGTVQGDLHDIGKNIVRTLLEAAGFIVHDIGVDQPPASFVTKAREVGADIVAMSALLTTTMPNMARVIAALREAGLRVRVMVGGAPVSREFANRIGAEGYAPDAVKAVREAERLMQLGGA
jgi:5-methyltetrahydrofolate--homocysteine methyltransferase